MGGIRARMSMLRSVDLVRSILASMTMSASAVAVRMIMKEHQSKQVGPQTQASHDEHVFGLRYFLWLDEALDRFKKDCYTQGDQEDSIYERTESFGTLPAVCVSLRAAALVGHFDGPQAHAKGENIVEHVEGIGHEGQRVDSIAGDEFDEKED